MELVTWSRQVPAKVLFLLRADLAQHATGCAKPGATEPNLASAKAFSPYNEALPHTDTCVGRMGEEDMFKAKKVIKRGSKTKRFRNDKPIGPSPPNKYPLIKSPDATWQANHLPHDSTSLLGRLRSHVRIHTLPQLCELDRWRNQHVGTRCSKETESQTPGKARRGLFHL